MQWHVRDDQRGLVVSNGKLHVWYLGWFQPLHKLPFEVLELERSDDRRKLAVEQRCEERVHRVPFDGRGRGRPRPAAALPCERA